MHLASPKVSVRVFGLVHRTSCFSLTVGTTDKVDTHKKIRNIKSSKESICKTICESSKESICKTICKSSKESTCNSSKETSKASMSNTRMRMRRGAVRTYGALELLAYYLRLTDPP